MGGSGGNLGRFGLFASRWDSPQALPQNSSPREDPFALAMDHYLKGNWFEGGVRVERAFGRQPAAMWTPA